MDAQKAEPMSASKKPIPLVIEGQETGNDVSVNVHEYGSRQSAWAFRRILAADLGRDL